MGHSRLPCPTCGRPPGGRHADECGQSRARMRDRSKGTKLLKLLDRLRYLWVSKAVVPQKDADGEPTGKKLLVRRTYVKELHGRLRSMGDG